MARRGSGCNGKIERDAAVRLRSEIRPLAEYGCAVKYDL